VRLERAGAGRTTELLSILEQFPSPETEAHKSLFLFLSSVIEILQQLIRLCRIGIESKFC
jgi:hypothetical protein